MQFHERDTDSSSEEEDSDIDGESGKVHETQKNEAHKANDSTLLHQLESMIADKLPRAYYVVASSPMEPLSDVFLIDHMWTTTFPQMREQLNAMPSLVDRIGGCAYFHCLSLLKYWISFVIDMVNSVFWLFTATFLGIDDDDDNDAEESRTEGEPYNQRFIDKLWLRLWPHMNSYVVSEHEYSQWYLMDEVGTSISHCGVASPNCRCAAFMFQPPQPHPSAPVRPPLIVSLLWPVQNIAVGDVLTRDYLPSVPVEHPTRALRLLGYLYPLLSAAGIDNQFAALINTSYTNADSSLSSSSEKMDGSVSSSISASVDWKDSLATLESLKVTDSPPPKILKVFCDRPDHLCKDFIHRTDRIRIVDSPAEADVLYLIDHTVSAPSTSSAYGTSMGAYSSKPHILGDEYIKKGKIINQYWWNGMLVSKEHFASTVKSAARASGVAPPSWLPVTYDLSKAHELAGFVRDFLQSEIAIKNGQTSGQSSSEKRNIWILKRYRGKQSVDYPITSSLSCALRHLDSAPRLACRYVQSPALFEGRKFDLRYYVIVQSLEPLVLHRHPMFMVRRANTEYSLDDLENYQKQFTVMSLLDDPAIRQVRGGGARADPTMHELIQYFDATYGGKVVVRSQKPGESSEQLKPVRNWESDLQSHIDATLRQVFKSVQKVYAKEPMHPTGQVLHPNAAWSLNQPNACPARAMFGVDVMLELSALPGTVASTEVKSVIQPVVLEVQWAPDCGQAVKQRSGFWDEILTALYLDDRSIVKPL